MKAGALWRLGRRVEKRTRAGKRPEANGAHPCPEVPPTPASKSAPGEQSLAKPAWSEETGWPVAAPRLHGRAWVLPDTGLGLSREETLNSPLHSAEKETDPERWRLGHTARQHGQDLNPGLAAHSTSLQSLPLPRPPLFSWLPLREENMLPVSVSLGEIHFQNLEVLKCVLFCSPKSPS